MEIIALRKLSFYGIKGPLLNWRAAFLKDSHQSVVVEGMLSGQVPIDSGVQQASVLGSLLFLLNINDLPNVVTSQSNGRAPGVEINCQEVLSYEHIPNSQPSYSHLSA